MSSDGFGVELPYDERAGFYRRYGGDSAVPGTGEIFLWQPNAS